MRCNKRRGRKIREGTITMIDFDRIDRILKRSVEIVIEDVKPIVQSAKERTTYQESAESASQEVTHETNAQREPNIEPEGHFCYNCGTQLNGSYEYCPECGCKVIRPDDKKENSNSIPQNKRCTYCGAEVPVHMSYCLNCGTSFGFEDESETFEATQERVIQQFGIWKNKWVALTLCLLFGWFGAHKYYEQKIGMGILYTFTVGLFGIGWIVDTIVLIGKPNPYRARM